MRREREKSKNTKFSTFNTNNLNLLFLSKILNFIIFNEVVVNIYEHVLVAILTIIA